MANLSIIVLLHFNFEIVWYPCLEGVNFLYFLVSSAADPDSLYEATKMLSLRGKGEGGRDKSVFHPSPLNSETISINPTLFLKGETIPTAPVKEEAIKWRAQTRS